ncbi:hypothetical protein bcCo53_001320 (plasmid) [Borrelia coriaceae]|nr:hypothetical protein [Borrelia coriaceae]UPA17148.1 hypothetical protein bcCo53_001320 [Borrelia coriaceae]
MKKHLLSLFALGVIACNITPKAEQEQISGYIQDQNSQKTINSSTYPKENKEQTLNHMQDLHPKEEKKEDTIQVQPSKLTQENIENLQKFLIDSEDYYDTLKNIYNRNTQYINEIMTYTQCNSKEHMVFCTSETNAQIRKNAIEKLNKPDLIKDLQRLAASIKDTKPQALINSIESLKQAIEQANLVKDKNTTQAFKTIKDAGETFINTINIAVTAYIDAFVNITSNFNSNNFIETANSFATAAKTFHQEVNIVALSPIIGTLRVMAFQLDDYIEHTKQCAINLNKDNYTGGTTFANAIDTLIDAYKYETN